MFRLSSSVRNSAISGKITLFKIRKNRAFEVIIEDHSIDPTAESHCHPPTSKIIGDHFHFQKEYDYDLTIACDRLRDLNTSKAYKMKTDINADNKTKNSSIEHSTSR
eukprot:139562_1